MSVPELVPEILSSIRVHFIPTNRIRRQFNHAIRPGRWHAGTALRWAFRKVQHDQDANSEVSGAMRRNWLRLIPD
jgi:hypothetical protein